MATFSHTITDLGGVTTPTLADEQALAALTIAAAGAIGLTAHGPPVTRTGPQGIAVGLLGHGATSSCTPAPRAAPAWSMC
jgi:hypothetical protein